MQVANVAMAADARSVVGSGMLRRRPFDHLNNVGVALATRVVGNGLVAPRDLNGVGIVAGGEIE